MKSLQRAAFCISLTLLSGAGLNAKEKRPDWLSGQSAAYPKGTYLTGIGEGPTQEKAADKARAEIAKYLSLSLTAKSSSSMSETTGQGASSSQAVSEEVRTSTAKVLEGVDIAESWADSDGAHYALAVLNREHALSILKDKLDELDRKINGLSDELTNSEGKFARLKLALRLVGLARSRRKLNGDYRTLSPDGKGSPAPESLNEALAQAREAVASVSVQVSVTGSRAQQVASRIIDGLSAFGLKVVEKRSTHADIVIEAKARAQALEPENLTWYWAKGTILSKMSYGSTGEVFTRFEESGQEAMSDPASAVEAALLSLADKTALHAFKALTSSELLDD